MDNSEPYAVSAFERYAIAIRKHRRENEENQEGLRENVRERHREVEERERRQQPGVQYFQHVDIPDDFTQLQQHQEPQQPVQYNIEQFCQLFPPPEDHNCQDNIDNNPEQSNQYILPPEQFGQPDPQVEPQVPNEPQSHDSNSEHIGQTPESYYHSEPIHGPQVEPQVPIEISGQAESIQEPQVHNEISGQAEPIQNPQVQPLNHEHISEEINQPFEEGNQLEPINEPQVEDQVPNAASGQAEPEQFGQPEPQVEPQVPKEMSSLPEPIHDPHVQPQSHDSNSEHIGQTTEPIHGSQVEPQVPNEVSGQTEPEQEPQIEAQISNEVSGQTEPEQEPQIEAQISNEVSGQAEPIQEPQSQPGNQLGQNYQPLPQGQLQHYVGPIHQDIQINVNEPMEVDNQNFSLQNNANNLPTIRQENLNLLNNFPVIPGPVHRPINQNENNNQFPDLLDMDYENFQIDNIGQYDFDEDPEAFVEGPNLVAQEAINRSYENSPMNEEGGGDDEDVEMQSSSERGDSSDNEESLDFNQVPVNVLHRLTGMKDTGFNAHWIRFIAKNQVKWFKDLNTALYMKSTDKDDPAPYLQNSTRGVRTAMERMLRKLKGGHHVQEPYRYQIYATVMAPNITRGLNTG